MPQSEDIQKKNLHKVAVMLTLVGREAAQQILKQMHPKDIERIGREMAQCGNIPKAEQEQTLQDFISTMQRRDFPAHADQEYIEEVITTSMDPERAQRFLKKMQSPQQITPFEDLHEAEPDQILSALAGEHPQTVALVIASLPNDLSAKVLKKLGDKMQKEVARRIAVLDRTSPDIETVRDIEKRLSERIKREAEKPEMAKLGGIQTAADILNVLDKDTLKSILGALEEQNEELAAQIKMRMVRFDDLIKLEDMEIQRILKEVETQDLAVSLIRCEPAVEERVFRNMSQRGAEMLKDDIEVMQNVKPDAIRAARMKIAEVMRRLDEEGTIVLNKQSLEEKID